MKRREFLKTTTAAAAMLSCFPATLTAVEREKASGKIERRTLLFNVRGSEIDRDPLEGEVQPRVLDRGGHPLAALADRRVGKPHDGKGGDPARDIDFDFHRETIDAEDGAGKHRRMHLETSSSAPRKQNGAK